VLLEADRHGTGRVADVPEHERTGGVRRLGDGGQVGEGARPVVDVAERDERDAAGRAGLRDGGGARALDRVRLDEPELAPEPLEDVAVGREVARVGDDGAPSRTRRESGAGELVEVHGHGIGDDHLARPRPEDALREEVADLDGEVDPLLPAAHERRRPLVHCEREPLARPSRQAPERVAVDVERPALLEDELVAEAREGVGSVEGLGVGHATRDGSPSGAKSSGQ
jgi:hypothetical protein